MSEVENRRKNKFEYARYKSFEDNGTSGYIWQPIWKKKKTNESSIFEKYTFESNTNVTLGVYLYLRCPRGDEN